MAWPTYGLTTWPTWGMGAGEAAHAISLDAVVIATTTLAIPPFGALALGATTVAETGRPLLPEDLTPIENPEAPPAEPPAVEPPPALDPGP